MYYHARELKYVTYGKVAPSPIGEIDPWYRALYEWLGKHCGYCPQIWLSRSHSSITGVRSPKPRQSKDEQILFGFEDIQGFPVAYDEWIFVMNCFGNAPSVEKQDDCLVAGLEELEKEQELVGAPMVETWRKFHDLDAVLQRHLFVKKDQVVVPSLNLKAAKRVACRNEKQKNQLRRMGFIEDRIEIRPLDRWSR